MVKEVFLALLILLIPIAGLAETVYDQPYLGEFPRGFNERFSSSALEKRAANDLAAAIRESDLIILADAEELSVAPESDERTTIYDAVVKILKTYKGGLQGERLKLKFRAYTTGIEKSARHVFFLKRQANDFEVLKSSFVYPRRQGGDSYMSLFGSVASNQELGLDVISYLAGSTVPNGLGRRLEDEYFSGSTYAAVHMAFAVRSAYGRSVLKLAVTETERERFDIDLFSLAAFGLAIEGKPENWHVLLEHIPASPTYGRIGESVVFDLIANSGGQDAVLEMKDVVARKPELAVSAAFALSKIGGEDSRAIIESWMKNSELANRE